MNTHRGHPIVLAKVCGQWLYRDTRQPVEINPDRPCGHCKKPNTPEGHDGCLGTLPGVQNACCGHGNDAQAYVQFPDGSDVRGVEARELQRRLAEPSS